MKFTLSWLKTHLDTEADLPRLVEALTMLGLEVDGVADRAKDLAPFTIAKVLTAEPHPNADRLRLCTVNTGAEQVQVVCGAPNARAGIKAVFAPSGSVIPRTGAVLRASVIRGVASNGMLCSGYELGLSEDHQGIIELPEAAPVGGSFAGFMGLDDPVLDVKITPNRADCLGVRGIARDLAAAGIGTLKPLDATPIPGAFPNPIGLSIAEGAQCPLFLGRVIRGVRNGPSPRWLADRLISIGLRPISALVDITNFMTFDLGRPLHVFDAGKVRGDLRVHPAAGGETLRALNGKDYALAPKAPAAARRRPRCISRRRCSIRSAPPPPAAPSICKATRATASNAASIRPSSRMPWRSRRGWCSIFAAARRPRSPPPAPNRRGGERSACAPRASPISAASRCRKPRSSAS
jgi:phenylalanyl-tRNA synthetase beta chain